MKSEVVHQVFSNITLSADVMQPLHAYEFQKEKLITLNYS